MADATARVLFDLLPDYERWQRRRHLTPGTIKRRRQLLTRFNRWCQGEGLSIVAVVTEDIERWLDYLGQGAKGISPQTRHNYTRVLSSFYGWAVRAEVVERDPTLEVVRPRLPRALPRPMDPADLVRAMDASDDRKAAMLALTAFAGLRCKEIAGLQIEDVDFKHKRILVAHGKGNKERVVPLHPEVERRLRRVAPEHGYVFHRTWPYVTPEPIKPETDFAEAARVYAQQAKLGTASINHAQVVKLRAERRLADVVDQGQKRGEIAKPGGDRPSSIIPPADNASLPMAAPPKPAPPAKLSDLGVSRRLRTGAGTCS